MSYKSVKLRYMLSFARSADLKITDEKERCQALHWQCRTAHSDFVVVIYVEIRQKIIGYCEWKVNHATPTTQYQIIHPQVDWTVGHSAIWGTWGNLCRRKYLVTKALFHLGDKKLWFCTSNIFEKKTSCDKGILSSGGRQSINLHFKSCCVE